MKYEVTDEPAIHEEQLCRRVEKSERVARKSIEIARAAKSIVYAKFFFFYFSVFFFCFFLACKMMYKITNSMT